MLDIAAKGEVGAYLLDNILIKVADIVPAKSVTKTEQKSFRLVTYFLRLKTLYFGKSM